MLKRTLGFVDPKFLIPTVTLTAKIESDVSKWKTEKENLKKQFEEKSPVCSFRKPNSPGAK